VVCTQVDHSTWDHRLSPNSHAFAIYLKFALACGMHQKGLKNVSVKMMMFIFHAKLGFPMMAIIVGYEAQSTPFPWSIKSNT
jgi:hypothetical protein